MKNGRRQFLKNILSSSAGLLSANNLSFAHLSEQESTSNSETADCIVIGAGMAGLIAARDLSFPKDGFLGYKTIVLEASHRIGGRILTLEDSRFGGPIELGADYIHRARDSRVSIWNDVDTYNPEIIQFPRMLHGLMYYEGWEDNLPSHLTMVKNWNALDAATFTKKIDSYTQGPNISAKEWLDQQNYSNFGQNLVNFYFTGHMPGHLDKLSVKGFASDHISEQLLEWNEYGFANGYGSFLNQIKKGIDHHQGKELDIRYNSPVSLVKYNKNGVEVTTKDGKIYRAKTAVITVSIGILKSGNIEFQPPLPDIKQQALSWIEAGDRAKVVLKFKKRFWPADAVFLNRIDNGREMARTYFLPFSNDLEKNNVLSVLFAGEEADKIYNMDDVDVIKALARDFDKMYPKVAKEQRGGTILNMIEGIESGHPTYLRWQWSNDPFTKGSVSYLKAGSEENKIPVTEARKTLADPSSTPGLFWAGEATATGSGTLHSSTNPLVRFIEQVITDGKSTQPSCTHGAHFTGKRAAMEVSYFLENPGKYFKFNI